MWVSCESWFIGVIFSEIIAATDGDTTILYSHKAAGISSGRNELNRATNLFRSAGV